MIGKRIVNYRIESLIGKGGMGEVYMATHETINRKVAIKSLLPSLIGQHTVKQRFINEAKVMSQLNHPNIVGLLDYHEEPDGLYLIMEYVDGRPLDELIKNVTGPIGGDIGNRYIRQILEAFEYAHSRGLVHRDIKPSNIMITNEGNVKVLDFGIAKVLDSGQANLTKTGMQMGTVYYMSPEQVEGKDIDIRSDIYALGVTIYQLATGTNPYVNLTTEFEIYNKITKEELPDPRSVYPGVSASVASIIMKATAKNPNDRFQTCTEMLAAFKSGAVVAKPKTKNKVQGIPGNSIGNKFLRKKIIIPATIIVVLVFLYTLGYRNIDTSERISLFPVKIKDKYSYFNSEGKEVIPAQYDYAQLFNDGIAKVGVRSKSVSNELEYGYIDETGTYVINPQYTQASAFNEGLAWVVKKGEKITAINTTGEELFQIDASMVYEYSEGLAAFAPYYSDRNNWSLTYGYLDKDGDIVIEPQFASAGSFFNGRAAVSTIIKEDSTDKLVYYFINTNGDKIGEYYEYVKDFEGSCAVVKSQDKYGAVDKNGKIVVPTIYDELESDNDMFIYTLNDKEGWLDSDGNILIQAQFDDCGPFLNADLAPVSSAEKWGYINKEGKYMINPTYDYVYSFRGDITAIYDKDKYGFIDKEGKLVINTNLEEIPDNLTNSLSNSHYLNYTPSGVLFTDYFDAAAIINNLELVNPYGLDPITMNYGDLKNKTGLEDDDFSKSASSVYINSKQGGGSSHSNALYVYGDPWSTSRVPISFYGYIYDYVHRSYFNNDKKFTILYGIDIPNDFEQRSNDLENKLRERLKSESYTESQKDNVPFFTKDGRVIFVNKSPNDNIFLIEIVDKNSW